MNILVNGILNLVKIPAMVKGMRFGENSYIAPGYDFLNVQMKNIHLGDGVLIGKRAWVQTIDDGTIEIGNNSNIGRNVTISSRKRVVIGKNVLFSYNVSVLDHNHEFKDLSCPPVKSGITQGAEIIISDDCFIGAHSFLMGGVTLGKHCVVGANSVVTKSFKDYSVIAGSPAKLIRTLAPL